MRRAQKLTSGVSETVPEAFAKATHFKLKQTAPVTKVEDLATDDAMSVGARTRFGRIS